jgi:hypothetical protein
MIQNQDGCVLTVALLILVLLTLIGVAASRTLEVELQIAGNHMRSIQAFYKAEDGITVARTTNFDIPPEFVDGPTTNIAVYYMLDDDGNTTDTISVESTGYSPSKNHPNHSVSVVEAGFVIDKGWEIEMQAALYVGGNFTNNGGSTVDGEADTGCEGKSDIVTTTNAAPGYEASDYDGYYGTVPTLINGQDPAYVDIDAMVDHMKSFATTATAENNMTLGSPEDSHGVYLLDDSSGETINNLTGYGVLVIDGNLDVETGIGGSIDWNGLILVRGNIRFSGGGSKEINGSVISTGDVEINGGVAMLWDCVIMETLKNKYTKYNMTWWRQL